MIPNDALLKDQILIGFDLETSGAYPLNSDICEIAAYKSQVAKSYRPTKPLWSPLGQWMIYHWHPWITNEMVRQRQSSRRNKDFHKYITDGNYLLAAHMLPLIWDFYQWSLSVQAYLCPKPRDLHFAFGSSVYPESPNHKLQTLIGFLQIEQGAAHRALDDSKACVAVAENVLAEWARRHGGRSF